MVEISSAPQPVFISVFVTRKGNFEAKEDADLDYVKKNKNKKLNSKTANEKKQ